MINCLCVIQENQGPDRNRAALEAALNGYSQNFLKSSVQITWLTVPEGNGFTAGKPSTSSVISMTAAQALEQAEREVLLKELVNLWTSKTDCSEDEVVAVIADPTQH